LNPGSAPPDDDDRHPARPVRNHPGRAVLRWAPPALTEADRRTVFLSEAASVTFGDYMTSANHVLPTAGRSRSISGLSVLEFLRSYTWQELSPSGAAALEESTARLAEAEGLPIHAAAARGAGRATGAPRECVGGRRILSGEKV
jgi:hypothetical protein